MQAYKPEKGYQLTTYLHYATENRFRACMGVLGKADALNHADRRERPIPGDEEGREQGDSIPDEKAEAASLPWMSDKSGNISTTCWSKPWGS